MQTAWELDCGLNSFLFFRSHFRFVWFGLVWFTVENNIQYAPWQQREIETVRTSRAMHRHSCQC